MNTSASETVSTSPRGFRRVAPAFVLFVLSPFVAEYLLGNISVSALFAMLFLSPMYGGGAILVREVARRRGHGWSTIVLLALAYGLIEEGIAIQTLFNPNYLGLHLLTEAYIPALGIGGWWTLFVLTLHTVWSISVPIAVTEAIFADRRETPWLGKIGLGVAALFFVAGAVVIHSGTHRQDPFVATPLQLAVVSGFVLLLLIVALGRRGKTERTAGSVPKPIVLGALSFALALGFMSAHAALHGWMVVGVYVLIFIVAIAVLSFWSRRGTWTPLHTLAVGGGAMMTYACTAFPQEPVIGTKGTVDLIGNTLFAAIAVGLLIVAIRAERKIARQAGGGDR